MSRFLDRLWAWLISRCSHADEHVSADVLEGSGAKAEVMVMHCRRCGAVRVRYGTIGEPSPGPVCEWRVPRPAWNPAVPPAGEKGGG